METQQELAVVEQNKVTQADLDNFLFSSGTKLTDQQKKLFYAIAIRNQLDPFKREIYAVPYGNDFSVITGYEVYIRKAERSGKLDGWEADYVTDPNGDYAYCTVYRKDQKHPITQKVWLNEFKQGNRMWNVKPKTMLIKVAIATTFRRAFTVELGGLPYTADEMPSQESTNAPVMDDLPGEVVEPTHTNKQSAKVKHAIDWTLKQGMSREQIEASIGDLSTLTEDRLPDLKAAYMAWKAEKDNPGNDALPGDTMIPCDAGGEMVSLETCRTTCSFHDNYRECGNYSGK